MVYDFKKWRINREMAAKLNESAVQIIAVVYCGFDGRNSRFKDGAKPYFFLDPFGLKVNDTALTHNGENFSIVRVKRTIQTDNDDYQPALSRITKPILAKIDFDSELISDCFDRLKQYKSAIVDLEIQQEIDKELYGVPATRPVVSKRIVLSKVNSSDDDEE